MTSESKVCKVYDLTKLEKDVDVDYGSFECCVCNRKWTEKKRGNSIDCLGYPIGFLGPEFCQINQYMGEPLCSSCYEEITEHVCGICGLSHMKVLEIEYNSDTANDKNTESMRWSGKESGDISENKWFKIHMYEHMKKLLDEVKSDEIKEVSEKFEEIRNEFLEFDNKVDFNFSMTQLYNKYHPSEIISKQKSSE